MKKRFLSALLALCMALTLLPSMALALPAFTVNTETGLAAAITNVNENGTIKLIGDITLSGTFNISGGKSFTIDLNGYTLTSDSIYGVIALSSGMLTIADSSVDKNGKITSATGNSDIGTINVNGGSLVVDSGTVENLYTGMFVHTIAVTAGNVTVNGGKVERINSSYSIYNTGSGTIRVNGGVVSGGTCAIYNTSGTVNVTGGEVSNEYYPIYNEGTVNVTGGTVKCTSGTSSYAIYNNDGSVNIGGGEVIGFNGIKNNGFDAVAVTGGTITSNGITGYAIYSEHGGSISVSGGQLNGKLSAIYCNEMSACDINVTGGALYSDDFFAIFNSGSGDLNVAGTAHVEGKTAASGGAIYYTGSGAFTIGGTAVVTSPRSSDTGGTVYVGNNSALNITGGTVQNTYAGATGNAIFAPNAMVSIASTSPVIIKGPGAAMTSAPYLINTVVKTAATNINGTDGVVTYNPDNINTYKYLKFEPAAVSIGSTGYASLPDAVDAVDAGQTIKLLKDTSENIYIPDTFTCSFTIDLNNFTLSSTSGLAMEYKGAGILTITDNSSAGGGTITASSNVIESNGNGKIRVSGKATISSTGFYAISITGGSTGDDVLEITGGTVQSSSNCAIKNEGDGNVTVSGGSITGSTGIESRYHVGDIIVSGGTITGSSNGIYTAGNVTLTGGMVENTGSDAAIYCSSSSKQIIIPSGTVVVKGGGIAMNKQPVLTDYTSYQWRISSSAPFTPSSQTPYAWSPDDTYFETKPAYSVTYRPGANGTGSVAVDAKTIDVALTLRGAIFTRNGFTQTGWAITDGGTIAYDLGGSYTSNEPITLYPVWSQNSSAPGGSGTTLPAGYTVYNDPSIPDATIWLSGSGLSRGDILVTETITNGGNYNAMLTLADSGDILQVYDISLQSGRSSTGSAMYLTFDLTRQYARQEFTLVHKKADGTFEYFYAKAGADGKVKFGPVYELSPFMLAKGNLLQAPSYVVVDVPKTGDSAGSLFIVLMLASVCGVGAVVFRKKRA